LAKVLSLPNALNPSVSAPALLNQARQAFEKIPDPRRYGQQFSLTDVLMSGLAVFCLKHPSLLKFDEQRNEARIRANLKALYGVQQLIPGVEHRQHKGPNNRAELSHQPTRQRERPMRRFKSPGYAQRFFSAHGPINPLFRPHRHRLSAAECREARTRAFETWRQATCAQKNA